MQGSALRLTAIDKAAADEGLAVGMTLADARARLPTVKIRRADPAVDQALLTRLGEACRRYTPALALHAPDGLDLDVTGCTDLFGGEAALLAEIRRRMARGGLSLRAALADTPALAYAVARFGRGGVVQPGLGEAALIPLPVAALRLAPEACLVLERLGVRRIGQVLDLPSPALARRLGEAALERLDEALGARACPLTLQLEHTPYRATRRMFEPICREDQVLRVVGDLARDLAEQLDKRALGGRRFGLELFRMDGAIKRLEVAASQPLRAPERIAALFAERLAGLNEGLEADFGFDQLRLTAKGTQTLTQGSDDLLQAQDQGRVLSDFADRLSARFGVRVRRLSPIDAHTPERAQAFSSLDKPASWSATLPARFGDVPLRPLRLFRPPQPIEVTAAEIPEGPPARFAWRRVSRTIVRAEGPERLETEWGQGAGAPTARDYYRLEDEAGRRYWVFRQGRYDLGRYHEGEAEPRWYIHGLFG
jgi:protein ImuB